MDAFDGVQGYVKSFVNGLVTIVTKSGKSDELVANVSQSKSLIATESLSLSNITTRREILSLLHSSPWTRFAGLLGATAVMMGAYGTHELQPKSDVPQEYKNVFETANKYHFIHSLALLAVPLTRRPLLVGSLMVTGMCLFCGTCYVYALTENKSVIQLTPYGGLTLILAWFAMVL